MRITNEDSNKDNGYARKDHIVAEYEGVEISEELMEELAGGTMTRGHERRLEKMVDYLKKQGRSKDECLNTLYDLVTYEEHDDIASVVERTYRY